MDTYIPKQHVHDFAHIRSKEGIDSPHGVPCDLRNGGGFSDGVSSIRSSSVRYKPGMPLQETRSTRRQACGTCEREFSSYE